MRRILFLAVLSALLGLGTSIGTAVPAETEGRQSRFTYDHGAVIRGGVR